MSAVLKSQEARSPSWESSADSARKRRLRVLSSPRPAQPVAFPTPSSRHRPMWLKLLIVGQRISFAMAAVTVTGALSAYALTVDANRRLTVATATLGQLQDHHQQLTTANAVFKNHLAETAITAMNEGALHPKDVIFLEAADPAHVVTTPAPKPSEPSLSDRRFFPKGY